MNDNEQNDITTNPEEVGDNSFEGKSPEKTVEIQSESSKLEPDIEVYSHDGKASSSSKSKKRYKRKAHQRRRKQKRKRESSSSDSSSDSSSSNSSDESDVADVEENPIKRFKITPEEDKYKWNLPKGMAIYANTHFEEYIPDKDIKEAVLSENPVPENIDPVKKLDDFLKDLLIEKQKNFGKQWDHVLEKIQRKTTDVMGPLSKVWSILEDAKNSKNDEVTVSIKDLLQYVEQTVLLLGQSVNSMTYHRRYNILLNIMNSPSDVKTMLREKATLLEKHDKDLFGKKFRNHITETVKSRNKTREVLNSLSDAKKKPFSKGPSHSQRRSGGQITLTKKQDYRDNNNYRDNWNKPKQNFYPQNKKWNGNGKQNYPSYNQNNGKYKFSRANLLQHESKSDTTFRFNKSTPLDKGIILSSRYTKYSPGRKVKILPTSLANFVQRSKSVVLSKRLRNTSFGKTDTGKNTQCCSNEFRTTTSCGQGSGGNVEEGSNIKSLSCGRGVSQQLVSRRKEGWGKPPGDQSKKIEFIHTLSAL